MTTRKLKILFTSAEAEPFVKIGGLGDYGGSLPLALQQHSSKLDVRLAIPFHGCIKADIGRLSQIKTITFEFGGEQRKAEIFQTNLNGLSVYLIRPIPPYADTAVYYGDSEENSLKYAFFSFACLEMLKALRWQPDVIHTNDWHTSFLVLKLNRWKKTKNFFKKIKTLITIHNLGFMGGENHSLLMKLDLAMQNPIKELPRWARTQPLPLGLASTDQIITVSPTYAKEILTREFGYGLERLLQKRHKSITGILNGINQEKWDPAIDSMINTHFSIEELEKRWENKTYLQDFLNLKIELKTPLLGVVSRMDTQKGIDVLINAVPLIVHHSWQLIILGSGSHEIEQTCIQLEERYPQRIRTVLRFDDKLARQIYAGADILIIPSRYEPCGTTQMIAMRYGCIPIARAVGGLKDTIHHKKNGYLFKAATANSLAQVLDEAIHCYISKPKEWHDMQYSAMKSDFSWEQSAQKYAKIYSNLIS